MTEFMTLPPSGSGVFRGKKLDFEGLGFDVGLGKVQVMSIKPGQPS